VAFVAGGLLQATAGYSHRDLASHALGMDDAYISYRYAENLAAGHGLVYNPGERVEGYSNYLYVLLLTPVHWVTSGEGVWVASVALNLLLLAFALLLFDGHVQRRLEPPARAAATLLFALSPTLWLWAGSGMETALVVLLQLSICLAVERVCEDGDDAALAPLCAAVGLSVLTRADGFIAPLIAVGYLALRRRGRAALRAGATLLVVSAAHLAWRYAYYGDLLPNTYYVKVAGPLGLRIARGASELLAIAMYGGLFVGLLGMLFWAARELKRGRGSPLVRLSSLPFAPVFAAGLSVYWLYIGGDQLGDRFLLVLIPLGLYALFRYLAGAVEPRAIAFIALALAALQLNSLRVDPRFAFSIPRYDMWVTLGRHLGAEYRGAVLAIDAAGKVPYFSKLPTIDMLGLNDAHIGRMPLVSTDFAAHGKYDADYVLSRQPALIAAWVEPTLDLRWGLEREKYESAGYRLRYLVHASDPPSHPPLIDVEAREPADIQQLVLRGYRYGVLGKKGR
jgi:hypothetical protein